MPSIPSHLILSGTSRGRALLAGLLLALGVIVLPAAPAAAASHQVMIKQYAYGPASLSIAQGDTVTWTNMDSVEHDVTVTSGPATFHSPMLSKGKSWSYTFSKPGTYAYICSVHPDMHASVSVAATPNAAAQAKKPAATQPVAGAGGSAAPTSATPKASTTVQPSAAPTQDTTYVASAAPDAATTLNPLLIVMGISAAVVVFCLLLMTSRPLVPASTAEAEESDVDH